MRVENRLKSKPMIITFPGNAAATLAKSSALLANGFRLKFAIPMSKDGPGEERRQRCKRNVNSRSGHFRPLPPDVQDRGKYRRLSYSVKFRFADGSYPPSSAFSPELSQEV
jgi:hypothetical protein